MSFEILIPELNTRPKNTKDAIINLLTTEWPLTLRNIYYRLKKHYKYSYTYQSVYKAVKELVDKDVLKANDKKYEINISWVKQVQSFTDIIETNYYAKQITQNFSGLKSSKSSDDLIILNFDTIFDTEKYLYYFIKRELFRKKEQTLCFQTNNDWKPIFYLRAEYNFYKRLISRGHKIYILSSGDSITDKDSQSFYKSIGISVKTSKAKFPNEVIVFSDYFIQVFIPEKLRKKIKECLEKKDSLSLLKEALEKKSSIKVIINKDSSLCEEIKNQIVNQF
ncbi:hypothetical protein GOV14_04535 [Candidatus Pacearchaeota archaeon]|nr:hypothetical protein [Candidatus Pacearchaeota archaeon]